ncbi:MAG: ABC transporter permease [Candidatus Eisenbacteria bacterium]
MIGMLIANSWKQLRRDRGAQVLAFVVPIAFFSIFAVIFGPKGNSVTGTSRVVVAVADESVTERSRALIAALQADSSLRVLTHTRGQKPRVPAPFTRAIVEDMVKTGDVSVALVLPAGIDTSIMSFTADRARALVLYDPSDPVASRVVGGLLQRAALRSTGLLGRSVPDTAEAGAASGDDGEAESLLLPLRIESRALLGTKRDNPMVAFYAAGVAVMFIMFSAASAGGVLIEETESGTLERVLTTGLGMGKLLVAKWLYITSLGVLQITVMFTWGMLVFHLPLLEHLAGFAIMTVCTASAAAAFGLVLATLSRTRQQLSGLANLLVLSLNAIGGSMFPRFLMSESLQKFSLVGFNAWALDGYLKVFWREQPLASLVPQVAMLLGFSALFLVLARQLARRWEAV